VDTANAIAVLDRDQLRDITMDDPDLMREILSVLVEDTMQHMVLLETAVEDKDADRCARLAHYCKGACANVGAKAAAEGFLIIERNAKHAEFDEFAASLAALSRHMEDLRVEVATLLV